MDARRLGAPQALRGGLIGNHQHDLCRISGVLGGLDQRHHVGAAAGNQDGDAFAGHI
jgi:hypothetical protein